MTIACMAGAERGGKRVEIIRESEQRARTSKGMERARPLPGHCFRPHFTFAKIVIGQNYLVFLLNNQTVCKV